MRSYLRVLAFYWMVVVAGLVLGLATASAVTFTATPTYASQVTFFLSVPGSADPTNATEKARSYVELLTNERLHADVVESLGLNEEPSSLANRITAQLEADTVLITTRVTDTSPAGAQKVADALSAAFVAIIAELEQPATTPEPEPEPEQPATTPEPEPEPAPPVTATVVQPATFSPVPVSPVLALNLALGAILGVLAGVGGALTLNSAQGRVRSLGELAELTGVAALGAIWNDPDAHAKPLAIIDDPSGSRAEGYRTIRTKLLSSGVAHKTVAVVSPDHADGRTATACNLAVALAQTGRKVALVDGDIRGPGVMDYLGHNAGINADSTADGSAGLNCVLTGALPSVVAMQPVRPAGFDVLKANRSLVGFSELLSSPRMELLLDELAVSYDTVIVDTAALLRCSDGSTLAALCSTTIMVAQHGQTTRKDLQAATDLLRSMSTAMIGGVLNMSPRSGARHRRKAEQVQRTVAQPGAATDHPGIAAAEEPTVAMPEVATKPASEAGPRHAAAGKPAAAMSWISPGQANGPATDETPAPTLGGTDVPRS